MAEKIFGYLEVHAVDHCNNNCRWCNNHSPFAPEVSYEAVQYIPWLEILEKKNIPFDMLSIMGGEPFLHDNLAQFILELRQRFPQKNLGVSTNGFWLGEEQIDSHAMVWKLTDILFLSLYPNLNRTKGRVLDISPLLERIRRYNPHINIDMRPKQDFRRIEYPESPQEPSIFCGTSECTTLLVDGRMARCGLGGYAHYNPHVGKAFLDSKQMFFDLKNDFSVETFWNWRRRWPFDACFHCTSYQWSISRWKVEKGTRRRKDLERKHDILAGERLLATQQPTAAERLFRATLDQDPENVMALNDLAVCIHRNAPHEALELLIRALRLAPDYADARTNLRALKALASQGITKV